ncbi:hypothetical protein X777_07083 [Ooceraea biroi]|uniref:Uncharacterized protein n=1 Tax=Ooceraea biroi TaxID=2015173 RepID=A0A026W9C3_OOCBI|nr:hypothetical protein X777_07083 [Ooceraea biroi]
MNDGENERNNVLCLLLDEVMEPELDELEVREQTKDVLDEIPKVDVSRILRDDLQLPVLSHEAATWQKKKLPEATSRSVKMLNDVHANIMKGLENQLRK